MQILWVRSAPVVLIALATPLASVAAQETLTEQLAIERALARGEIAERDQADRDIGAADVAAVRRFDNPSLEITREGAGGETEWQLGAVQPIDLSGRRGSLRAAALAEAQALEADIVRRRQELVAETRTAFVACAAAGAELTIWRQQNAQLAEAERVASARAEAGDTAIYDVRRVRVEARSAEAEATLAEGSRQAACASLASLTGIDDPEVSPAAMTALSQGAADGSRADIAALEQRLMAANQRVQAARQARLPQIGVGAGVKRVDDGTSSAYGPILTLGVTLPIFDGGGPAIAAAEARERSLGAELAISRRKIEAEQTSAAARALAAREAAVVATRVRDDAGRLGPIAETAYHAGEIGVAELLDAYAAAREAELSVIRHAQRAAEATIAFDLSVGRPVP